MKKSTAIIIILSLLAAFMTLCSCDNREQKSAPEPTTLSDEEIKAQKEADEAKEKKKPKR